MIITKTWPKNPAMDVRAMVQNPLTEVKLYTNGENDWKKNAEKGKTDAFSFVPMGITCPMAIEAMKSGAHVICGSPPSFTIGRNVEN